MSLDNLKYPIGPFKPPTEINIGLIDDWKKNVEGFPSRVMDLTKNLDDQQLNWIYRPDGWSIRQVIHHCADSHMNAFIRFKLSLSEDNPTIKPYLQGVWADQIDYQAPIDLSLKMLDGVHSRWILLMNSMVKDDFRRTYNHPEMEMQFRLDVALSLYSWHCRHHSAHIEQAIAREGNF